GWYGSGNTLTISNGGTVQNASYITVGSFDGANNNAVLVAGPGSVWTNGSYLYLGFVDNFGNNLTISNGGQVFTRAGLIGGISNARDNSTLVTGLNSAWHNSDFLYIGETGHGNALTIANSGAAFNTDGVIGYNASTSNNAVTVTGASSAWNNSSNLYVGYQGSGNTMTIADSGAVFNATGYIGFTNGADNNAVLVTGSGSVWSNSNELYVGLRSSGNTLTITNGGAVFNNGINMGAVIGGGLNASNNAVLVTGSNSLWNNSSDVWVGIGGSSNTLTISSGGQVYNEVGIIGDYGNHNAVTVTGSGSVWLNSRNLIVGWEGGGSSMLTITDGGHVYNGVSAEIGGFYDTSNNRVLVTGQDSIWNNSGDLDIGNQSSGNTLTVANGGRISNVTTSIGKQSNDCNNAAIITGPGSAWNSGLDIYVGYLGSSNSLTIANGGDVHNNSNVGIGYLPGANYNAVTITGTDSVWVPTGDFYLGAGYSNTLTIADGGKMVNWGQVFIGCYSSDSSNNAVTVTGSGSVWRNYSVLYVGDQGSGNTLTIANGGAVLDTYESYIGRDTSADSNAVLVTGANSLWNNKTDLYVGYHGSGNTLTITNGGAVAVSGTACIGYDAGVIGNQIILAGGSFDVTNAAGNGTLDVRNGTLTLKSGTIVADQFYVTNGASSTLAIELHSVNSNVVLTVGGSALLGGALNVAAPNGFKPALSNAFTILTAQTVNGAFAFTNLPPLGDAFAWSVTYAPTSVVLSVVNGTSPYALWAQARIPDLNQRNSDQNADSDAYSNWQEYIADTDPTNPSSYFQLVAVSNLPPLRVYFLASSNRQYTMNWCSNLVHDVWTNVPGQGPRSGAGGADWMQDTNLLPAEFYRIDVQLP
ncbi:MAG: hypothetical protein WCL16_03015, partial [bacterium]